jgi:hypothetical protein
LKKSVNLGLPSMMRKREKEGRSLYLNPWITKSSKTDQQCKLATTKSFSLLQSRLHCNSGSGQDYSLLKAYWRAESPPWPLVSFRPSSMPDWRCQFLATWAPAIWQLDSPK